MQKVITTNEFIRGLRASIPDFVPNFEEHEGRLVSLEIVCPEPFDATPVEFHCVEIVGEGKDVGLQKVTYCLSSQGKLFSVSEFMRVLQENFLWLTGIVVPAIRILVGPEGTRCVPSIELAVEPQTEDGRFVLSGAYSLEEKERSPKYREPV